MNQDLKLWREGGRHTCYTGEGLVTLQSQMTESTWPHIVAGVLLGMVGTWFLVQAGRETSS